MSNQPKNIEKTIVPLADRENFLPKYIGNNMLRFEFLVYKFMEMFCKDYSGGHWEFIELSNGGAFMSYGEERRFHICNSNNYFDGEMSSEAVSIGVNMFALNSLMDIPNPEKMIDLYYALRDFACEHKESQQILSFID